MSPSVLSGMWLVSLFGLCIQSCSPPSGGGSGEDGTEDPPLPGDPGIYVAANEDEGTLEQKTLQASSYKSKRLVHIYMSHQ